jgi:hypothetical protein
MKRILVLVAAIGLILPAAANAGAFQGVVIAKNAKRNAIVTASANGTVRTVRAPESFRKIGLGALVAVRASKLPDGTFSATGTKQLRRAKHARVRATVVKRTGRKLYLSAGNSVFAFGLRNSTGAKLRPGDRVAASASFGNAQLFCDEVTPVGHADQLALEGIYLSTEQGVLSLAVHGRGLVKVTVPDGFSLPELKPGDEVSLAATVEPDGSFTLVSLDNEDASNGSGTGNGDGVDMGDNWFTVTGVLSSLSSTSVGVDVEQHPEPVRCSVPSTADLSGFAVGQFVQMSCKFVDGKFVLVKLRSKTAELPGDGGGSLDLKGFVTALNPTLVTVNVPAQSVASVSHEGQTVSCGLKPGEDLRGFAVGDFVEIKCEYSQTLGHYMLTGLSSDSASLEYGDGSLKQWFDLSGVLTTLAPTYVAVQVAHHDAPVQCSLPTGMDLRGFAVGDAVEFACVNTGSGFYVKSISSDSASWPENDMPQFTVDGVLKSMRSDGVGVQVVGHSTLVNCAMPAGTDLSGFALGDTVEMQCNFHDGKFNLASLSSDTAQLTLE